MSIKKDAKNDSINKVRSEKKTKKNMKKKKNFEEKQVSKYKNYEYAW